MSTGEPDFVVSMSAATAEELRRLAAEADGDGLGAEFRAALRSMFDRLRTTPRTFGEELFDLRAMGLTVRLAVVLPAVVEFGVYPDRRLVFARAFRYVPPA